MNSIGIDVSKEKSTVCILRPYGEVVMSQKEFYYTDEDVSKLIMAIKKLDGETRMVLEATVAYHFPLVSKFTEAGLLVAVINPFVMKKICLCGGKMGQD